MKTKYVLLMTVLTAIMISATLLPLTAKATTITYLTISNENLGVSGNFASVSVTVSGNTALFYVDANNALLGVGSNFGIQAFGFNSSITLSSGNFTLPSGWNIKFNQNLSEFGLFYAEEYGTGSNRQDPLVFSITNGAINSESQFYVANSGGYHYAAHIAGFSELNGMTSAWFADGPISIPEPEILVLLGLGLLSVIGFRKFAFQ